MRSEGIDKSKVCVSQQDDLSKEHFIELIGKRVEVTVKPGNESSDLRAI